MSNFPSRNESFIQSKKNDWKLVKQAKNWALLVNFWNICDLSLVFGSEKPISSLNFLAHHFFEFKITKHGENVAGSKKCKLSYQMCNPGEDSRVVDD